MPLHPGRRRSDSMTNKMKKLGIWASAILGAVAVGRLFYSWWEAPINRKIDEHHQQDSLENAEVQKQLRWLAKGLDRPPSSRARTVYLQKVYAPPETTKAVPVHK